MTIVTGMRLYTGSDSKTRDPASYVIEGWNSNVASWDVISQGDIVLPDDRHLEGEVLEHNLSLTFSNNIAYGKYRIQFPKQRGNPGYRSIGEIQLPGILV
eukprot:7235662-Ditylum_brightwellii.AAC.1